MNDFELHTLAQQLTDTLTPYQLAKLTIPLAGEVAYQSQINPSPEDDLVTVETVIQATLEYLAQNLILK